MILRKNNFFSVFIIVIWNIIYKIILPAVSKPCLPFNNNKKRCIQIVYIVIFYVVHSELKNEIATLSNILFVFLFMHLMSIARIAKNEEKTKNARPYKND